MSARFYQERSRVGVLTRYCDPDDPDLLEARRRMREEALIDAVNKALAKASPLTPGMRDRIADLLVVTKAEELRNG